MVRTQPSFFRDVIRANSSERHAGMPNPTSNVRIMLAIVYYASLVPPVLLRLSYIHTNTRSKDGIRTVPQHPCQSPFVPPSRSWKNTPTLNLRLNGYLMKDTTISTSSLVIISVQHLRLGFGKRSSMLRLSRGTRLGLGCIAAFCSHSS